MTNDLNDAGGGGTPIMTHKIPANLDDEQAIMPAQWAAMLENPHAIAPELRLVLAVIEDGFRIISHPCPVPGQVHGSFARTWWNTYDWLIDLERRDPFSLVWICEALARGHDDPFTIAKRIADRVKLGQGFAVMPRRPVVATQKVGLVWRRGKRRA